MITKSGNQYIYSIKKGNKYYDKYGRAVEVNQCVICGWKKEHIHHCMSGRADRAKCDEMGLVVPLCNQCHWLVHNKPVESGLYYKLKEIAQKVFEKYIGSRKEWMGIFHKNYL